eukprot:5633312-Prymnesium_polylepis.1
MLMGSAARRPRLGIFRNRPPHQYRYVRAVSHTFELIRLSFAHLRTPRHKCLRGALWPRRNRDSF